MQVHLNFLQSKSGCAYFPVGGRAGGGGGERRWRQGGKIVGRVETFLS